MFISYASALLKIENALLYATVPPEVVVLQLNPNVFAAVILPPEYFFRFGFAPSNPPWNGTMNFLVSFLHNQTKALLYLFF